MIGNIIWVFIFVTLKTRPKLRLSISRIFDVEGKYQAADFTSSLGPYGLDGPYDWTRGMCKHPNQTQTDQFAILYLSLRKMMTRSRTRAENVAASSAEVKLPDAKRPRLDDESGTTKTDTQTQCTTTSSNPKTDRTDSTTTAAYNTNVQPSKKAKVIFLPDENTTAAPVPSGNQLNDSLPHPTGDYADFNAADENVNHSKDTSFDMSLESEIKPAATATIPSAIETAPEEFEDTLDVGILRREHDPAFQSEAGLDFGDTDVERRDDDEGLDYYENR